MSKAGGENLASWLVSQDSDGRLVRGEQGFEALAQRSVALADDIKPRGVFLRRPREREGEQGFFVGGSHGMSYSGTAQPP